MYRICEVDGCEKYVYARGVCGKHYTRWLTRGTLDEGVRPRGSLIARFEAKIDKSGPNGCWTWTGAKTGRGYGAIQEGGRGSPMVLAHRVSYETYKGQIPNGLMVLHGCDNRECVNPDHLRVGTGSENIREAFDKKRKTNPIRFGSENGKSKITLEQAKFIKAHPELQHTELAKLFGVSPNCIRGVRIGRTWKDA